MEIDYKINNGKTTMDKFFEFAYTVFKEYDEVSLTAQLNRANNLIITIPQTKNFIRSPQYIEDVEELTNIVSSIDISEIDSNNLECFFNYLMSITQGSYYHNFDQINENLFSLLVDLTLSFMCQNHEIIWQFFNCGFLNNVKFFLDVSRKDSDIYKALSKALVNNAPNIQKRILDELGIQRFCGLARSGLYGEESNRLHLIYKILALFIPPNLSDNELKKCLDVYRYALENNLSSLYSAISIGLFKKIEKYKISSFRKDIPPLIIYIYNLLIKKMKTDENPDLIMTEYNFYISAILLSNKFKIYIDYNDFQSYISHPEPRIQIAAIYFFHQLTNIPEILQEQGLDVIHFIKSVDEIYHNSIFLIKEHLNRLILAYLKLTKIPDLFEMLENGFTETVIEMIQTFPNHQVEKGDLFKLFIFLNCVFEATSEAYCLEQFSCQFEELGGFKVLQEFIDDPKYPLIKENEHIPEICQSMIERFKIQEPQ